MRAAEGVVFGRQNGGRDCLSDTAELHGPDHEPCGALMVRVHSRHEWLRASGHNLAAIG